MKKRAICSFAVVAAMASAALLSACNDSVTWDWEAPAYGADADVTLSVNGTKKEGAEYKISDTLFGVFLEDINYASYYLDDNLLINGSFDAITRDDKHGWTAIGNAAFEVKTDANGIFAETDAYKNKNVNPGYARVATGSVEGGLRNAGYINCVPFAVQEGADYIFSAFIKNAGAAFDLKILMTDGKNNYLEETVNILENSGWIKYTRRLTASGTKSGAGLSFELRIPANTEMFIDGVSLETGDSTVGIKNIPYNAIKDLSPKFIRFPGGCIIEGNSQMGQECAYDWKNSIGAVQNGNNAGDDVVPAFTYQENSDGTLKEVTTYGEPVTRKPNPDLWALWDNKYINYYDMTYAIGFYEYFLLCESVGASAVPVVNCGLSCQGGAAKNPVKLNGRHNLNVKDYIRDAIDLIEFAKGDTDTKWGKIRSDLGHPEPFEMSYLGIGNEQYGVYFSDYYEKFLEDDAFMNALERYSVKPIVGNGMFLSDCEQPSQSGSGLTGGLAKAAAERYLKATNPNRKIETVSEYGVVDQHYYVSYPALLEKHAMYDSYLRSYDNEEKYYEVFVGEYSANGGVATEGFTKYQNNEWITALSEAAIMTGYERNGDIIKLAAYAPMFGAAQAGNQWGTDMMYYTSTELVLSTNYYVQQLFMKNQGAYRVAAENHELAWREGLSPTFELAADNAGSTVKKTVDKLYYVASLAENGDVIIKIVNACGDTVKADVSLSGVKLKGNASVTVLQCDDRTAKNTLTETNVAPESFVIGAFSDGTFGYEIKPYSVISITVHVR